MLCRIQWRSIHPTSILPILVLVRLRFSPLQVEFFISSNILYGMLELLSPPPCCHLNIQPGPAMPQTMAKRHTAYTSRQLLQLLTWSCQSDGFSCTCWVVGLLPVYPEASCHLGWLLTHPQVALLQWWKVLLLLVLDATGHLWGCAKWLVYCQSPSLST